MDGTPFNSKDMTPRKLKVTYGGQTAEYDITVEDYVIGLKIKGPDKDIYAIGEELELDGATVCEQMASGVTSTPEDITQDMISEFNSSTPGAKTIVVTYKGQTGTFSVTVVDKDMGVILKTLPTKREYEYGESLNLSGRNYRNTKRKWKQPNYRYHNGYGIGI